MRPIITPEERAHWRAESAPFMGCQTEEDVFILRLLEALDAAEAEEKRLREVFREYYIGSRTMAELAESHLSPEVFAKKDVIGEEETRALDTFVHHYARAREIEKEMGVSALEPLKVRPAGGRAMTCMHCGEVLAGSDAAKAHVAICDQHPAVVRARQAEAQRDWLAELAAKFSEYGACAICPAAGATCTEGDCAEDLLRMAALSTREVKS